MAENGSQFSLPVTGVFAGATCVLGFAHPSAKRVAGALRRDVAVAAGHFGKAGTRVRPWSFAERFVAGRRFGAIVNCSERARKKRVFSTDSAIRVRFFAESETVAFTVFVVLNELDDFKKADHRAAVASRHTRSDRHERLSRNAF